MGPVLGPAAALLPLLKMAPAPLQRGGHAKTALGSLPPDSGTTSWRAELCRGESRSQGRDAAPLGVVALWEMDVALCKGDVAPLSSSAP